MPDIIDSIGKRLKLLRKTHNLTQKEFATSIKISQGNLSEMEKDKISPSYDTLILITKKYEVSADWILTGETTLHKNELSENLDLKEMYDVLHKIMSDPDPEIRIWAKIQFRKSFSEYMPTNEQKK